MKGDVLLWRICRETPKFKADDLSGGGAKAFGGRWHKKGTPVIYAATTIALATLETLAHLGDNIAIRNAFLVCIRVPESAWTKREYIDGASLPPSWLAEPPGATSIEFGDDWLKTNSTALLMVPSVIVPEEYNALINPLHPSATTITSSVVRQFVYDSRL
jgi:RES domain-containing protein